jgi:DNA-binding transcriptional regulator YhcF (GntR family)
VIGVSDTLAKLDSAGPADLGDVAVDRDAEVPIGVQLAWALRSRIGDGRLTPGQRLPGLRELADSTGVNVNTVRAVYQRLEQEDLIASHQGSGTFVAAAPQPPSAVGTIAASAAREALQTGVDPRAVAAALYVAGERGDGTEPQGAERRRLLRAQITELERALSEIEAAHPGVSPQPISAGAGIGPALLNADELEQVRASLLRRLADVQADIDARAGAQAARERESLALAESARAIAAERASKKAAAPKPKPETPKRAAKPRPGTRPAPAGT